MSKKELLRPAGRGAPALLLLLIAAQGCLPTRAATLTLPYSISCPALMVGPDTIEAYTQTGTIDLTANLPNTSNSVDFINARTAGGPAPQSATYDSTLSCTFTLGGVAVQVNRAFQMIDIVLHLQPPPGITVESHTYAFGGFSFKVSIPGHGTVTVSQGPRLESSIGAGGIFEMDLASSVLVYRAPTHDFRGVGRSDELLYDFSTGTAYTALSNGDGTFQYVYNLFTLGFDHPITGDFNGDGKTDLVLYNSITGLGYIGMSNGDGTFHFQSLFWSPGYNFVLPSDLNGDGKTDFVLTNSYGPDTSGTIAFSAISDGMGGFTYKDLYIPLPYSTLHLADFTGDGKADLFVYNSNTGAASLGIGDGEGGFTFHPMNISPGYTSVAFDDLNSDGKMDVILYNFANGNAATGISDGQGGFRFTPLLFTPGFTYVGLADFTGDGRADLILYSYGRGVYNVQPAVAYFGTGNGDGTFTFQSLFWNVGFNDIVVQDLNGDGKMDVLLYARWNLTATTGLSNGDGTFTYKALYWGSQNWSLADDSAGVFIVIPPFPFPQ